MQAQSGIQGNRYSALGDSHTIAANRLSYTFDLQGPSLAIDTACSSSLVSLHMACESLRRGEFNAAVVGGVNLMLSPELSIVFTEAQMLSPDGLCKSFDDSANGYVQSEGGVVVIVKRLSDARAAGDVIHAVIKGSAVNQDGATNGITAPNRQSQVSVIKEALQSAKISADLLQLIETHGTGTKLGDPIEYAALVEALDAPRSTPCLIGSVKSNIGHLEAAAGLTGVLKLVMSLKEATIPASLHFKSLNKQITPKRDDLIEVASNSRPWVRPKNGLRAAGISSFGFGGTNAHMIIAEGDPAEVLPAETEASPTILRISARSLSSLELNLKAVSRWVESQSQLLIAVLSQAMHHKRSELEYRAAIVVSADATRDDRSALTRDAMKFLESPLADRIDSTKKSGQKYSFLAAKAYRKTPKILFAFSGQGTQVPSEAAWLYKMSPVFRDTIEEGLTMMDALAKLEDRYEVAVPINRLFTDLNHARGIAKFIAEKIAHKKAAAVADKTASAS